MRGVHFVGQGHSYVGLRARNEDRVYANDAMGLYLVADGMGGHDGGAVAATACVTAVHRFYERGAKSPCPPSVNIPTNVVEARLDMAFRVAHNEVRRKRVGSLAEMGSTLVAVRIVEDAAYIAHVGDSRAYRLRARRLERLTRDHSLVQDLEAAGLGALPQRRLFAHVITRGVGIGDDGRPDVRVEPIEDGDVFLLCTDGLTDVVADERIAAILAELPADFACATLVGEALRAGSRDNISALVVAAAD